MKSGFFLLLLLLVVCSTTQTSHASTIQLPRTGQTVCYDIAGAVVGCPNTGQDGDKLAGVAWPTPRFVDNTDGTVTDNLTGLVWLKNADCFGVQNWQMALGSANTLASGACGLQDSSLVGDWRLPNVTELESLVDAVQTSPALQTGHPFVSVQNLYYWTSSTYVDDPTVTIAAWIVDLKDGYVDFDAKSGSHNVWLVRNAKAGTAQTAAVQLPRSGQTGCWDIAGISTACSGTGQDADKLAGTLWPDPRFSDNGNGTVNDNLTGLVWLKNTDCFGLQSWDSALISVNSLASGSCSLSDGSIAGNWRLPNRKELQSLIDRQKSFPALSTGHPFNPVRYSDTDPFYYWTSSSVAGFRDSAWIMDMLDGYMPYNDKNGSMFVWPVRDPFPNQAPVISEGSSISLAISKNSNPTAFSLTLHATDADNDSLTWSVSGNPSFGTATAGGSGTSVNVSYSPTSGYVGQDSFMVQVSDGKGGLDSITVNLTVNQTYTVSTAVTGNGSIDPSNSRTFNSGAGAITTYAVFAGTGSYIAGVTGCAGTLSGNTYTTGAIIADCTVAADFKITQVKVPGNGVRSDYNTLQEAYANPATVSGMTLQTRINTFVENVSLDRPINVTIKGGYDSNFQPTGGYSTVQGSVSIRSGSLTVDGIVIR